MIIPALSAPFSLELLVNRPHFSKQIVLLTSDTLHLFLSLTDGIQTKTKTKQKQDLQHNRVFILKGTFMNVLFSISY